MSEIRCLIGSDSELLLTEEKEGYKGTSRSKAKQLSETQLYV